MNGPLFVFLCGAGFLGRRSDELVRSPGTKLFARYLGVPTALIGLLVASVTITGVAVKLPATCGMSAMPAVCSSSQTSVWTEP